MSGFTQRLANQIASGDPVSVRRALDELVEFVSGGGGSSAGNDGEIQFNDGDVFGADPDFVWDATERRLKLVATENGTAEIVGNAPGVQLQIFAADGDTDHVGGELVMQSGASSGGSGGDLTVQAGSDSADGDGGNVTIASGGSLAGDGGEIAIRANPLDPVGNSGGDVLIQSGNGVVHGGDIVLDVGGPDGVIQINGQGGSMELNTTGLFLPAVIDCSSLPILEPGVAGQLWNDAGTLKISGP